MQRIFNVDKWFVVEAGKSANFGNSEPRRVRIDVNSPGVAQLFYATGDGEITFLARIEGRDVIEFATPGEFSLMVEGSDCWMYTIDGKDLSFVIPDAVILTKLMERRARNPELELMQYQMQRNQDIRFAQQREELEQLWARREAAAAVAAAQPPAASPAPGASGELTQDGVSASSGAVPAPVGGSAGGTAEKK